MIAYKVLVAFELDGVQHEVGSTVELSEEVGAPLVAEGKLEIVVA
jgi:hypothetical protein